MKDGQCPSCLWCGAPLPEGRKKHCDQRCIKRSSAHRKVCADWPDCQHERPRYGKAKKPALERLYAFIDQNGGPDACWPWTGHRGDRGYGFSAVWIDGQFVRGNAHRLVYEAHNGLLPEDVFVLHSCDNAPCCNLRHLRAGDQIQNMADRQEHGAGYPRGAQSPTGIDVDDATVEAIRAAYRPRAKGRGQHALAARFGLSRSTVQRIVTRSDRWMEPA